MRDDDAEPGAGRTCVKVSGGFNLVFADGNKTALHHEDYETDFKSHVSYDECEHARVKERSKTAEQCEYAHEGDCHENIRRHHGNVDAHVVKVLHLLAPGRAMDANRDKRSEDGGDDRTHDGKDNGVDGRRLHHYVVKKLDVPVESETAPGLAVLVGVETLHGDDEQRHVKQEHADVGEDAGGKRKSTVRQSSSLRLSGMPQGSVRWK